jgi:capsular exopolysaccharide synthesis family protein
MEKEKKSLSQTEDNPYMQNLNAQIAGARADMLSSLRSLRKTLLISRSRLQSHSSMIAGQVKNVPAVERTYLDLTRQQQIKQELYVFLLKKREETAISKTSNISNCRIIEPPVSFGPISPIRVNVLGYSFLLGLFLPVGLILLTDKLNTRITSKDQIATFTEVPIIGEIGHNDRSNQTIVVDQESRSPISEQFRTLRTNLSFFLKSEEKTILLTSSMSGEGKSFISLNLATVLAISGKKVVVIEMDLRKPNLTNKLNLSRDFGFTNYIVNKDLQPENIIMPTGTHPNLCIISSGQIPPNPAEMIMNDRTESLLRELKERFDYIILDAPPVGLVTDAQLLSKYADLNLYVVRQACTYKDQLNIPQEIYTSQKMKNIAILVNDIKYTQAYGYGYGYGYGYEEKNTKRGSFLKWFKKS